jgi:AraC family transcriptional regulator
MVMTTSSAAPFELSRFVDAKPMLIAGLAERHRGTNAAIPAQWQRFAPHIGGIPAQIGCAAYGVIFDSLQDTGGYSFGYLAGVEVANVDGLPENFGHLEIPAQRYAVFAHCGHVSALSRTIGAIVRDWLPASGCQHAGDGADLLERYGDVFNRQTGLGGIEVWLPIET